MNQTRLFRSSTFRLALIYMALFGASILILLGFIYWSTVAYMGRQTDAIIEAEIEALAERYRVGGLAGLTDLIAERLSRKPAGSSIYLVANGLFEPMIGNLDRWPSAPPTPDGWLVFQLEDETPGQAGVREARARVFRLQGGFHLLVGRDMHERDEAQGLIMRALVWGLAITVVLALVGGSMMSRSMVRRLEAINAASREIMQGDLSRRIPAKGTGDDFDRLTDNLNSMLDRIELLMDDVRRVSDSIAHDLRTPLSRLRHRLELLNMPGANGERMRESVEQAVAEADRLLTTFNALLRIARIESEGRRAGFTDLDFSALLRDVVELYEPLAEDKQQRFNTRLRDGVQIHGDRDLLFQAIANLVDNAIKYAPAGGAIELAMESDQGGTRVTVADDGPGISASAADKVFQRFFRQDASRSTPGSGLGLSLVAAVAKLHQAQIALHDNRPGLRVVLDFGNAATKELSPQSVAREPSGPARNRDRLQES
ncbi:MAG: ATP-binding protein [Acidiferrobacterales bacterium]